VEFRHALLLRQTPEKFITDYEVFAELEQRVGSLAIPRRMRDFADKVLSMWQTFRAGIEGTISGLKRAFRLARCFYRGFKHFQGAIGLGVFAHNLVVLANPGMT
jgi:hypothetical protein